MSSRLATLFFGLIASIGTVQAQSTSDFQTWSAVMGSARLSPQVKDLKLWFDGHVRRGDPGTTLLIRPGMGYSLTPWMAVWAGYAWIPTFSDVEDTDRVDEHRLWQQLVLSGGWADNVVKAQSRTRLEQRWNSAADDTALRLRQLLRTSYQLNPKWGIVVWDELFWGLGDTDFTASGFDQNRLFIGPAVNSSKDLRIEFGYLWAALERQDRTLHQHVLALNFVLK